MREKTSAYTFSVCKPEIKIPLGRLRRKRKYNNKMDLTEGVWEDVDWTQLDQETRTQSNEPHVSKNCWADADFL
jgi:hypothetical protein